MDYVPIGISALALGISAVNLYLTQIRKAALTILAGEYVHIFHFIHDESLAISIPVTVSNAGARGATVCRLALLVRPSGGAEGYLLEPLVYEKADENTNMKTESLPVPITVAGRSAETRQVLFRSSAARPTEFQLRAGEYGISILVWMTASDQPHAQGTFTLVIEQGDCDQLARNLGEKNGRYIRLRQAAWRKWSAHCLTDLEVRALKSKGAC